MSRNSDDLRRRLEKVVSEQQLLLGSFNTALANGEIADHRDVQAKLLRLGAEMQRLAADLRFVEAHGSGPAKPRGRITGKAVREQILDVLDEIGVPLAPATISEFALATMDADVAASRFASLRRDEERAARRDVTARPAWVAPALSTTRLTPIPRLFTSSAWAVERRLVGARSLRVNHLRTTLAFLDRAVRLAATDPRRAQHVETLMLRFARGIPGAVESSKPPDPRRIRDAIHAELELIEADDREERLVAAGRLAKYGEQQRIWGLLPVIEGGTQGGSISAL